MSNLWISRFKGIGIPNRLKCCFEKEIPKVLRDTCQKFVDWLDEHYFFPERVTIYFRSTECDSNGWMDWFYEPDGSRKFPSIVIHTGSFSPLYKNSLQNEGICQLFFLVAWNVSYYYQWIQKEKGVNNAYQGRQAKYWSEKIVYLYTGSHYKPDAGKPISSDVGYFPRRLWLCADWSEYVDTNRKSGLYLHFEKGVHSSFRKCMIDFAKWLRHFFEFPVAVNVYIKTAEFIYTQEGEPCSALIRQPYDKARNPYIKIATGDIVHLLGTMQEDDAFHFLRISLAHELSHYFQWIKNIENVDIERQAKYYGEVIDADYYWYLQDS